MPEKKESGCSIHPGTGQAQTGKKQCADMMATGVAHDFNNLLAAIIGNASIVLRNLPADSPLLKNVAQIETSARKAVELTNLLQLCAAKGAFNIEVIDLNELVGGLAARLKESIHDGIDIQYRFGEKLPFIKGDAAVISQALINLVNNAASAILECKGVITISTGTETYDNPVRDECCLDEITSGRNHVYIEINDTGCGIPVENLDKIFDPFFSTRIRGQGLGLSVALGVARVHGGRIFVSSTPGKGSTFKMIFPSITQA